MGSYLYSCPGFWSGFARLLDFGNTYDQYNRAPNGGQADALGLLWDWATIADDMQKSLVMFEVKYNLELRRNTTADKVEFANR